MDIDQGDDKPKASTSDNERVDGLIFRWNWQKHWPILTAGLTLIFICIRLLAISDDNFQTADAILQYSGTATIIIGALLPSVAAVILPIGYLIGGMAIGGAIDDGSKYGAYALACFLFVVSLFITPVAIFIVALLCVLAAALIAGLVKIGKTSPSTKEEAATRFHISLTQKQFDLYIFIFPVVGAFILIVLTVLTNSVPWLPAEVVTSRQLPPFTGFVISNTDADVVVLNAQSRTIVNILPDNLISLSVCQLKGVVYSGYFVETLPMLIGGKSVSKYRSCIR